MIGSAPNCFKNFDPHSVNQAAYLPALELTQILPLAVIGEPIVSVSEVRGVVLEWKDIPEVKLLSVRLSSGGGICVIVYEAISGNSFTVEFLKQPPQKLAEYIMRIIASGFPVWVKE